MCPRAFYVCLCVCVCRFFFLFHSGFIMLAFSVRIHAWKLSCVINIIRSNLSYCVCIFDSRLFQRLLILVTINRLLLRANKTFFFFLLCWQNKNNNKNTATTLNASCFSLSYRIQCYLYKRYTHYIIHI